MTAIDDLNAVLDTLTTGVSAVDAAVNDLLAEVANLQSGANTNNDAAIESAAANVRTAVGNLQNAAANDPGRRSASTPAPPTTSGGDHPSNTPTGTPIVASDAGSGVPITNTGSSSTTTPSGTALPPGSAPVQ